MSGITIDGVFDAVEAYKHAMELRIRQLQEKIEQLEKQEKVLYETTLTLRDDNWQWKEKTEQLEKQNKDLRSENSALDDDVYDLQNENDRLRGLLFKTIPPFQPDP